MSSSITEIDLSSVKFLRTGFFSWKVEEIKKTARWKPEDHFPHFHPISSRTEMAEAFFPLHNFHIEDLKSFAISPSELFATKAIAFSKLGDCFNVTAILEITCGACPRS